MYLCISPSLSHKHTHTRTHTRYLKHSNTLSLSQRAAGEHGTTLVDSFQAAVQLITLYSSSPPTSSSSGAAMSTVGHNNQPSVQSRQQVCLLRVLFAVVCSVFNEFFRLICPVLSCRVLSCPVLSCFFLFCSVLSCFFVYHLFFPVFLILTYCHFTFIYFRFLVQISMDKQGLCGR